MQTSSRVASAKADGAARSFSLYTIIISVSLLVALNPLSVRYVLGRSEHGLTYPLAFDLCVIAIIAFAAWHLRSGRRLLLIGVATAIAATPIVMFVAELAITYGFIRYHKELFGIKISNVYEPDPRLGWRVIPNTTGHHISPGNFDVTYHSDAFGRRVLPAANVSKPTIYVFGSSFTFSDGVNDDEAALYLIADANRDRFQMRNYSVSGYGLDQMVLSLDEHQNEIQPGDVVLLPTTSSSMAWNWIERAEPCQYRLIKSEYPAGEYPILTPAGWRFYDISKECGLIEAILSDSMLPAGRIYSRIHSAAVHEASIEHADLLLNYAKHVVAARGARFLPILLVNSDECRLRKFSYDIDGLKTPLASMMNYCPPEPPPSHPLSFPDDWHYTVEGNRWMADILERILAKRFPDLEYRRKVPIAAEKAPLPLVTNQLKTAR